MLSVKFYFFGRLIGSPKAAEEFRFLPAIEAETKELATAMLKSKYEVLRMHSIEATEIPIPLTYEQYREKAREISSRLPASFTPVLDWYIYEHYDRDSYESKLSAMEELVEHLEEPVKGLVVIVPARPTCRNKTLLAGK